MKKVILIFIFSGFFSYLSAQKNSDYRLEIGLMGGISSYMGDANKTFYGNIAPTYGGLIRYRFDTRFAVRGEYSWTETIGGKDYLDFANPVHTMDLCGEFNFFDLEQSKYKRFSKIYTPYIFLGIGGMLYDDDGASFGLSFPFGVGFKLKMGNRVNLNIQLSNRLLFKDNLEGIPEYNDPYGLNGSNPLNNDFLSSLTIGVTFNLWARKCECIKF